LQNLRSEAFALVFGPDGEQAEVAAAVGVCLEIDAGDQVSSGILMEQKFTAGHVVADAEVVNAIVVEDRALHDKRGVDHPRDCGNVSIASDAHR
jgi:hypothetical protein